VIDLCEHGTLSLIGDCIRPGRMMRNIAAPAGWSGFVAPAADDARFESGYNRRGF
jgi:hypothetical protein